MKHFLPLLLALALICTALMAAPACAESASDVTSQCKFYVTEGKASVLKDNRRSTSWGPEKENAELGIALPAGGAGYLALEWKENPTGYALIEYDENKAEIARRTQEDSFAGISLIFPLSSGTRYVALELTQKGQRICSATVYSAGELPAKVQVWQAPYEKCDLMVVSTHQDDELIFFGGIIPYYERVMNRSVQVVYMANCGRSRRGEALDGLWTAGLTHYPEFINLKDEHLNSIDKSIRDWGGKEDILEALVERIRRYRPEVILTHDLNGEYGHPQHKITARAMQYAVEAAADATRFPDSAQKYGAWQVKKLYLHLYDKDQILFNWKQSYAELGNKTPLEVARAAYACHVSQQKYYSVNDGGKYDNALFGLQYSTVGEDELHQDLFEHLSDAQEIAETAAPETAEADPFAGMNAEGGAADLDLTASPAPDAAPDAAEADLPAAASSEPDSSGAFLPGAELLPQASADTAGDEAAPLPADDGAEQTAAPGDAPANVVSGESSSSFPVIALVFAGGIALGGAGLALQRFGSRSKRSSRAKARGNSAKRRSSSSAQSRSRRPR